MRRFNPPASITLLAAALLSGLVSVGCDRQPQSPPPPRVPEVATVTIQPQAVMLSAELPGRTSAYRMAEIRPQVSGLILKRLFAEGSDVKAGQVLYQIDVAPFQAAMENAEASRLAAQKAADRARAAVKASLADVSRIQVTLDLARTNRQRYEEAFDSKVGSAIQRDQAVSAAKVAESTLGAAEAQVESNQEAVAAAEAMIQQAQAALKTVRINLGYTQITAPISGRIGRSNVTEGAVVTAYQPMPLATIQQLDPIYVDVPQSTTELLRLKNSSLNHNGTDQNKVKLFLEGGGAYPLEGVLQFGDVTVDPTTGSVILRVVFPNPKEVLLPGMFVRTVIKEGVNEQAMLIPQQGLSRDHRGNPLALIVDAESKVGLRMLTVDRAIGDQWLVSAGLAPGDRLIVEGMQMLRPGTVVKAVPFVETKTGRGGAAGPGTRPQGPKDGGA
ncbi:MAG: efflux RND transporter periplasmic adaptor subunit [Desulfobacterales bacterium]|nr:efflux RND transporter periplasmic adaptor subunit [Desulfobacterales bacterium]